MNGEVLALSRAHHLFDGTPPLPTLQADTRRYDFLLRRAALNGPAPRTYRGAVERSQQGLRSASEVDDAAARVIASAHRDRAQARQLTKNVLDQARADAGTTPVTPLAQREAVRAALSRLGCPYVWGATGPGQFDCSGLVQWSYAQAGVRLDRTTYQQINDGIPVPRSQVRPGDLVFPHAGHVQLAIGNNLVVEAPYAGAPVRVSRLGSNVAIRRPW
ncbi:NLP/P60 family protein [Mycobacterium bohemicum DSM 44277]|uniref:NLP/P60 family protein n=1 Tax=Mycobacterium bohemicum DSM 44277 TaxID=1236609 RepID=A0A0U0WEN4_MYCBE|nr:C40 family peptidase [Mycobacterium bohemicum]CPR12775.1 NLP/P60 family protein [Mycobacterium bohemicum DSM 44277]